MSLTEDLRFLATYKFQSHTVHVPVALQAAAEEIERLRAELENAESALVRHGFRKSCDIPACNCGDQWGHGGRANERLREIDEALPYENGKTILQRVCGLVDESERLRAECEGLRSIILWALGENGKFPDRPEKVEGKPHPLYWWRKEMRQRLNAAIDEAMK